MYRLVQVTFSERFSTERRSKMSAAAVVDSSGISRCGQVATAAIGAALAAVVLVGSSAAAVSPTSRACPSVSIVNAALGQKGKAPVTTKTAYSKKCTYPGGILPTSITFQVDTSATFAASEKAVSALSVKVNGLGQAAWATKVGGSLYVFDNGTTIKILAPLVATAKLEVLARKLL